MHTHTHTHTHVWLVISVLENNLVLSVHGTMDAAYRAREQYVSEGEFGTHLGDYFVSGMRMNHKGVTQ